MIFFIHLAHTEKHTFLENRNKVKTQNMLPSYAYEF